MPPLRRGGSGTADTKINLSDSRSEAEWEYAARSGGDDFPYAGHARVKVIAWIAANAGGVTQPVRTRPATRWGLHDLSGNVWEWCWDRHGSYPSASVTDPQGPSLGSERVVRGGSWHVEPPAARVAARGGRKPTYSDYPIGFHVVRTLL